MDRALDCGSKGCEFNSHQVRKLGRRGFLSGTHFEISYKLAGCWSGLTGWFRKPCEAKVSRGFKSLSRRHCPRSLTDRTGASGASNAGSIPAEGAKEKGMKFEFSAGGIVLRQAQDFGSKPQSSKKKFVVLVGQHSQHHGWVFPKGLIGDRIKGEKKEETAIREVEEETGVRAKIVKELKPVTYWYVFEGEKIKKTVYYFLMEYLSGDTKNHDFEMENVEWIPIEKVAERLTYKSDREVWKLALQILNSKL